MLNFRMASLVTCALVVLWVIGAHLHPLLELSENQALYTFSSESQVIAAIYGLTITGYIFLRNQQDRVSAGAAAKPPELVEEFDAHARPP